MKAIILAAGRGSRMQEQTEDRPKCLVRLSGRTLLTLQLAALRRAGISEVGIVTGYRADMLVQPGIEYFHNPRWPETNMVASLLEADAWLSRMPCVVSYSDIFFPAETVSRLMISSENISISYDQDWLDLWRSRFRDPLSDAESFRCDVQGRLVDIGRKVEDISDIQGQYMGLLRFTPVGWQQVKDFLATLAPARKDKLDMTSMLSALLERGVVVEAVQTAPGWGEVDSGSDLAWYEAEVAAGRLRLET
jgi:choline kinase